MEDSFSFGLSFDSSILIQGRDIGGSVEGSGDECEARSVAPS